MQKVVMVRIDFYLLPILVSTDIFQWYDLIFHKFDKQRLKIFVTLHRLALKLCKVHLTKSLSFFECPHPAESLRLLPLLTMTTSTLIEAQYYSLFQRLKHHSQKNFQNHLCSPVGQDYHTGDSGNHCSLSMGSRENYYMVFKHVYHIYVFIANVTNNLECC